MLQLSLAVEEELACRNVSGKASRIKETRERSDAGHFFQVHFPLCLHFLRFFCLHFLSFLCLRSLSFLCNVLCLLFDCLTHHDHVSLGLAVHAIESWLDLSFQRYVSRR